MRPAKIRIGEILVQKQLISQADLEKALARGKLTGKKLGRVLVETGMIGENEIAQALANQIGCPYLDLKTKSLTPKTVAVLPEQLARRAGSIAADRGADGKLLVAMSDPADVFSYDEIAKALNEDFVVAVATESDIFAAIDRYYRKTDEIEALAGALSKEVSEDVIDFANLASIGSDDAPVVKLLQTVFEDAVASRASDIHIEPMERKLVIRFRIDGVLHVQNNADPKIAGAVCQRLKLISGLNISERRLPQDGRFNIRVHKNVVDVRIATTPTAHGEAVVMRILNHNTGLLSLDRIGMSEYHLNLFKDALARPQGMILVTGPTGSGKTTTLYSALNAINEPTNKIITVEDPIEYRIEGINQIQVHEKIGLTFSSCLRSMLRQDPDVILIGEMRDTDTVENALRASMTGHLVLSTLHTLDAKSTPARLLDMGAEKFMVASSLHLVVAQRLMRLNCPQCKVKCAPSETELGWLYSQLPETKGKEFAFFRGAGCSHCANSGYYDRCSVYEMLVMDKELVTALYDKDILSFTQLAGQKIGNRTIAKSAAMLALKGHSTLTEARKIAID